MQTWSKNFFPGDPHLVGDAGKDGRLDEVALGKCALTASLELGSIFLAALDLKQRSVNKGAQLTINSGTEEGRLRVRSTLARKCEIRVK